MADDGLNPDEAIHALRTTIEQSGALPDSVDYIEHTPGNSDNTKLPILVISPVSETRITDFNTDQVGYVTDENGNRVGRIFHAEYRLDLQLDLWTAEGSDYDERSLGNALWPVLYEYSSKGPAKPLTDEDGNSVDEIWKFRVADGQPANDLSGSPALRRWRQDVTLWAYHRFDTTEDYVTSVNYPIELSDDDGDGQLEG